MGSRGLLVVIAITLGSVRAGAEPVAQPWAVGVDDARKASANQLLAAGNRQLVDHDYAGALATYRAALAAWDHPAIRFNIVRCLIQLDRPIEAADNLDRALAYGAAPLEEAVYTEALAYAKLLTSQIATVAVRCDQPGAQLTLDGRPLASCPAKVTRRVQPGPHQVVGTREGYVPRTIELIVVGGAARTIDVELVPLASATAERRRWRVAVPWVVFGGGLALAGLGGAIELKAGADFDAFDRAVAERCARTGCVGAQRTALDAQETTARREHMAAVAGLAVGALAAGTGAVLLYLNRAQPLERGARLSVSATGERTMVGVHGWF